MTAAQDAASAAERVIASAEDEVRQCLAEADEPYPFPDLDAGDKSAAQDRSDTSLATVSVSVVTGKGEELVELQKKVDTLSEDAASKEALVAKLQSQLDQLVQQLAEKRDAIHDVGAWRKRTGCPTGPYTVVLPQLIGLSCVCPDAKSQASNAPAPAQPHLVERGGKLDEQVGSE
jgi:uncharacterized coiled-coil protein SlyX